MSVDYRSYYKKQSKHIFVVNNQLWLLVFYTEKIILTYIIRPEKGGFLNMF